MSKNHKYLKKKAPMAMTNKVLIIDIIVVILLIALVLMLILKGRNKETPISTEPTVITEATTEPTTEATTEATTVPTEPELEMLPHMAELYAKNPDVAGWVRIDDTKLDYPVMYTPEDQLKYIHTNFEGNFEYSGVPYMDIECSLDPESTNLIIYGHNMQTGTHFRTLMKYDQRPFLQSHPKIYFSTLYEEREYEIFACFYDRVLYASEEDQFEFYNFENPETEEEFNEGIEYFKKRSLHDTGITPEYGDRLIMLVTCAYHVDNGRFVVVGRLIEDEPIEETVAATE